MTLRRLWGGLCAAILFLTAPAPTGAQSDTQSVTDPQGHYTILFPAGWHVISVDSKMLSGNLPKDTLPRDALPTNLLSMLVAVAPTEQSEVPIHMLIMSLPIAVSPDQLKGISDQGLSRALPGYKLVQEGTATIAGRGAYYQYFTWGPASGADLYEVLVAFSVGQSGFLIMGGTANEPERVRRDFPVIAGIIETFHPNEKSMTAP